MDSNSEDSVDSEDSVQSVLPLLSIVRNLSILVRGSGGNQRRFVPLHQIGVKDMRIADEDGGHFTEQFPIFHGQTFPVQDYRIQQPARNVLISPTTQEKIDINNIAFPGNPHLLQPYVGPIFHDGVGYYVFDQIKSLRAIVKKSFGEGMKEGHILVIMRPILASLNMLHQRGLHHSELCLSHIFVLVETGEVKLGFDGTNFEFDEDLLPNRIHRTFSWVGAPERNDVEVQPENFDLWDIGVIMLEMVYGGFEVRDRNRLGEALQEFLAEPTKPLKKPRFSLGFKNLVAACMSREVAGRPQINQIIINPIFNGLTVSPRFLKSYMD